MNVKKKKDNKKRPKSEMTSVVGDQLVSFIFKYSSIGMHNCRPQSKPAKEVTPVRGITG